MTKNIQKLNVSKTFAHTKGFQNRIKLFLFIILLVLSSFSVKIFTSNFSHKAELSSGKVTVYLTTSDRSEDFSKSSISFTSLDGTETSVIALDPATRYQEMEGFGAAVTGSTCYNLMQMSPENRTKFLTETFSHEKGMGFSYVRISIGCSDFSLSEYSCCDMPGIENFSLQEEELKYVIPILKEILEINPGLKFMGSPWTPPPWMKVNNLTDLQPFDSWISGQLNPALYEDYATYFVKWIQAFADHGIQITSITPQNEPLNRGNSASLFMGWEEQRDFLKVLGPKLANSGLKTKIYLFDHNYNYDRMTKQFNYPVKIYQDEEVRKYVAGSAYHNYGGNRKELLNIHEQAPDMELVFTETSIGTWNDGQNLSVRLMDDMREVALGTVNNWCKAVIVWNLMLDSDRGPNRELGCRTCYGAVDIDTSDYKTIVRNSHYYIIGHLSAVVKPGAVRIKATATERTTENEGIAYSAFENADGSYAFVLLNDNVLAKPIKVSDGNNIFSYMIPAKAVASFSWDR